MRSQENALKYAMSSVFSHAPIATNANNSVVSLTTVGFGDYGCQHSASKWFCILWLPFSVGFMSLYLTNVAAFYIRLSDKNIVRIDQQLRRRVEIAKRRVQEERDAARQRALRGQGINPDEGHRGDSNDSVSDVEAVRVTGEDSNAESHIQESSAEGVSSVSVTSPRLQHRRRGFDSLPVSDSPGSQKRRKLFGMRGSEENRRERILRSSHIILDDDSAREIRSSAAPSKSSSSISTMRDILNAVRFNLEKNDASKSQGSNGDGEFRLTAAEFFSLQSSQTVHDNALRHHRRKPSFALRVLVQERLAEIIAAEVAGYQDSIEIHDHTMSVTIRTLKQTADRWKIPRRARKAFRAVAFEVLFFVGEYGLVTRGAEALYDLTPLAFHGLFAPLLAALGDAEIMEGWLVRTQVLADVDLRRSFGKATISNGSEDPLRPQRPDENKRRSAALPTRNKTINITAGATLTKMR